MRQVFTLDAKPCQVLLVACPRLLKLLHVVFQLVQQRVVGIQLGAQLLQLCRLGVPEHPDQFAPVLGSVLAVLQFLSLFRQLAQLALQLCNGCLLFRKLCLQALDLAATGQNAVSGPHRTAGKRTAHIDLLPVQCDRADAVMRGARHHVGVVDVVKNHGSAQQRGQHIAEFRVAGDQRVGNADIAAVARRFVHLARRLRGLHRGQREESCPPGFSALEGVHRRFGGPFVLHHTVLQVCSKGDFQRRYKAVLNRNHLGERTVNLSAGRAVRVGDLPLVILLHYVPHRAGVALKMLLHRADGGNALRQRILAESRIVAILLGSAHQHSHPSGFRFGIGDFAVNRSKLGIVFFDSLFFRGTLTAQPVGNLAVAVHFLQCRTVLVEIGRFGVVQDRNPNVNVLFLGFQVADIGKRLRNGSGKIVLLLPQRSLRGVQAVLLGCQINTQLFQLRNLLRVRFTRGIFGSNRLLCPCQRALGCRNQVARVRDIVLRNRAPSLQFVAAVGLLLNAGKQLLALPGDHLGNLALPDDRIAVTPDTGVHEQLINILQTHRPAVDEVFAVPGAIVASGHRHLVKRAVQLGKIPPVVERDRHLGIAHRAPAVRAAENDILHLAAAQALGGDFTKHPAHGIGNVGFSGAVRSDDDRHPLPLVGGNIHVNAAVEQQSGLIGKGLEALHFQ